MNDVIAPDDRQRLIAAAIAVRGRAYAKYSNFQVGAALLAETGEIVTGCNVENASYGLTICAERNAVFTAVARGQTRFRAMALATSGGAAPCGACRQVLAEFCDDLPIWMVDVSQDNCVVESSLGQLLPNRFAL
jgi:cytidine deaminase